MARKLSQAELKEFKTPIRAYLADRYTLLQTATVVLLILVAVLLFAFNWKGAKDNLDFLGTLVGLIPVVPILVIYHTNKKERWESRLPKFVSADFICGDKLFIRINYVPLIGEHELRAQALSASTLLINGTRFPVKQFAHKRHDKMVVHDKAGIVNNGEPFVLYRLEFVMSETKEKLAQDEKLGLKQEVRTKLEAMNEDDFLAVYPSEVEKDELIIRPHAEKTMF